MTDRAARTETKGGLRVRADSLAGSQHWAESLGWTGDVSDTPLATVSEGVTRSSSGRFDLLESGTSEFVYGQQHGPSLHASSPPVLIALGDWYHFHFYVGTN